MTDGTTRGQALAAIRGGLTYRQAAERFGIPRGTLGYWIHQERKQRGERAPGPISRCPACTDEPLDKEAYSYLLGLYLGDGHIISKPRQHHLSIACCAGWPGLIAAADAAMGRVMPDRRPTQVRREGCIYVRSHTMHWVCLFPQHGPGLKSSRPITLADWQQEIVDEHPWELLRGLIHSDGCRITNWTVRKGKRYEYPRYFFTNKSTDILRICSDTLDAVGVSWRVTRRAGCAYNISVARRDSVALMDVHIGPKY